MVDNIDLQDRLNQLTSELSKAEKRQNLEYLKIEKLVNKSELRLSKRLEQLRNNEQRIQAWILQKSRSSTPWLKVTGKNKHRVFKDDHNQRVTLAEHFIGNPVSRIEDWADLPTQPALHNLFVRRREIEKGYRTSILEDKEVKERASQVKQQFETEKKSLQTKIEKAKTSIAISISEKYSGRSKTKNTFPKMDIENWEDAESFAVKYMRWLGFADARKTRAGSDEGKDVESSKAVAQVKDMGTGVSRPMLQQLFGVAAAEEKLPVFFARSYAKTAKEWGQKHGMALFQFSIRGDVKAVSTKAEQILKKKAS
jgi:hypothetical protein